MDLDKPMQSLDNVLVTYVKKGNKYSDQEKGWILAVYNMYNFVNMDRYKVSTQHYSKAGIVF